MKFHVKYRDTGYYLCGLEVSEGNGKPLKDPMCFQCSCESKVFFYGGKSVRYLDQRIAMKKRLEESA